MRISFTGDISLDKPMLDSIRALENTNKEDNCDRYQVEFFEEMLQNCQKVFSDSKYVIGNLETVFGGEKGYNRKLMHCNSPDVFAKALKNIGINVLTTANNHSLDEGEAGLYRTLDILDAENIYHTGTFRKDETNRILYLENEGIRIAIISYTYGVNPCKEADECINIEEICNLFQPYKKMYSGMSRFEIFLRKTIFTRSVGHRLRIVLGKPTVKKYQDVYNEGTFKEEYLKRIIEDLKKAKDNGADYTFVCLHSGGQFNEEPGGFTAHAMDVITKTGNCTAIIGNHPHIIQKIVYSNNALQAFSLGGFSLSPDANYISRESIPEYSLVLHFDLDKTECKVSYDILHNISDENGYLRIFPINQKEKDSRLKSVRERLHCCLTKEELEMIKLSTLKGK